MPPPQEPLRVVSKPVEEPANTPALRVEEAKSPQGITKKPTLKVQFAPLPTTTMQPTYKDTTGIRGNQRRRQHRHHRPQPLSTAKGNHPRKGTHRAPVSVPTHRYETRSKVKLSQTQGPPAIALLGSAVNPDTGKIAEYKELSQCSEGPLWQASNAEEIGRLTQGFGGQKGTDTMFFIPHTSIPKNKKPTYLRVVSAFRPEKMNPRRIR